MLKIDKNIFFDSKNLYIILFFDSKNLYISLLYFYNPLRMLINLIV
jgi:hypothetical protein